MRSICRTRSVDESTLGRGNPQIRLDLKNTLWTCPWLVRTNWWTRPCFRMIHGCVCGGWWTHPVDMSYPWTYPVFMLWAWMCPCVALDSWDPQRTCPHSHWTCGHIHLGDARLHFGLVSNMWSMSKWTHPNVGGAQPIGSGHPLGSLDMLLGEPGHGGWPPWIWTCPIWSRQLIWSFFAWISKWGTERWKMMCCIRSVRTCKRDHHPC